MIINLNEHKEIAKFLQMQDYSELLDKVEYIINSNIDNTDEDEWFSVNEHLDLNCYEGKWFLFEVVGGNTMTESWIEIQIDEEV